MKKTNHINKCWCIALTALLAAPAVHAQNEIKVDSKPNIVYSDTRPMYRIGGILVDGIQGFDNDVLVGFSGLHVGDKVTVPGNEITDAVNRYWKQGLFSNVRIEADSIVGDLVYLHIKLTARPRASRISFHGIKKSEREDLEERLGLKAGSQITPNILDRTKYVIERYFEEKGYKNVKVNITQHDDVSEHNQVMLDIDIDKNEKIKVKNIYLTGVSSNYVTKVKRSMKKTLQEILTREIRGRQGTHRRKV